MSNLNMTHIICFVAIAGVWLFISCRGNNDKGKSDAANPDNLGNGFVKKMDTVWFYDVALENVDPLSFVIVDDYFFKDKYHVCFFETYRLSQDYFTSKRKRYLHLEKADPASFESLGDGYAKDKWTAWYLDKPFKVEDLKSLTVLNHHFIKDNKTAYLDRKMIGGSDGKTFEVISDHYAKDFKKYYYCTPFDGQYEIKPIPCHYESFVVVDYQYAKDKSSVFYEGDKISKAESYSFELISDGYAKDINRVYFRDKIVEKADPSSFKTLNENENSMGETIYAKDKNGIYVNDKHFAEADAATFKVLNEKYSMDKKGVYFRMKKVKNVDRSSFKVYPHFMGDTDAEDQNHKYSDGKIVK